MTGSAAVTAFPPRQRHGPMCALFFQRAASVKLDVDVVNEVVPGLLLGGLEAVLQLDALGTTHVLSVIDAPPYALALPPEVACDPSAHLHLRVEDTEAANLLACLPRATRFIREALTAGGRVLVHCQGGLSRSATVVAAYLMASRALSADAALRVVATRRRGARPNAGFVRQLQAWHSMGCTLDEAHPSYGPWKRGRESVPGPAGGNGQGRGMARDEAAEAGPGPGHGPAAYRPSASSGAVGCAAGAYAGGGAAPSANSSSSCWRGSLVGCGLLEGGMAAPAAAPAPLAGAF